MKKFIERLNKTIDENQISRYKICKELGYSKQAIYNWCSGAHEPKISELAALAEYLDVSADYLLGLKDEEY